MRRFRDLAYVPSLIEPAAFNARRQVVHCSVRRAYDPREQAASLASSKATRAALTTPAASATCWAPSQSQNLAQCQCKLMLRRDRRRAYIQTKIAVLPFFASTAGVSLGEMCHGLRAGV